jgi:hypothetical protein
MNSSNYLFLPYVISRNSHQNLLRKMFVFGIPSFINQKYRNTGTKILTGNVSPTANIMKGM